jgi:hypothetical protein
MRGPARGYESILPPRSEGGKANPRSQDYPLEHPGGTNKRDNEKTLSHLSQILRGSREELLVKTGSRGSKIEA